MIPYPTENMRCGRRRIEEISEVSLLKDWTWDTVTNQFYLHISISLEYGGLSIPQVTEWYITATTAYPFGPIAIYPGCRNSLTDTFPHQAINAFTEKNNLWRKGKLCVNLINQTLGMRVQEKEPYTVDDRLFWNVHRAVLWLLAAADGTLVKKGDIFELPEFPTSHIDTTFAFQEDCVSMMIWEDVAERYGVAKIVRKQLLPGQSVAIIHSFQSIDSQKTVFQPVWGTAIDAIETYEDALWVRLEDVPVLNGWQAPVNLIDLRQICASQNIDLLDILKAFAPKARDGSPHLLLVGIPIPAHIGELPCEMTWQAIKLPILSCGQYTNRNFHSGRQRSVPHKQGAAKGCRPGEVGWWLNDLAEIFKDNMELLWIPSENWSTRTIKGRGKLSNKIAPRRIAIIGLGSLGASVAELLARAGATHLTCIDGNRLEIGNLCRHTLSMRDLYQAKSKGVTDRIADIDPNIRISYVDSYLSLDVKEMLIPELVGYDIIIDTTGEDQVLSMLATEEWKREVVFCTSSVGLGAKRLYINIQRTNHPCFEEFLSFIEPYFKKDADECDLNELPRDGVGCWHPLFPARADDMWLAACTTIKALESFIEGMAERDISLVYEIQNENELFTGFQLIRRKYDHE